VPSAPFVSEKGHPWTAGQQYDGAADEVRPSRRRRRGQDTICTGARRQQCARKRRSLPVFADALLTYASGLICRGLILPDFASPPSAFYPIIVRTKSVL